MTDLPESTVPSVSLLDAARVVARGGPLDTKLAKLAEHARAAKDGSQVSIHLLDAEGTGLVPVGWSGEKGADGAEPAPIALEGVHAAISAALADRRPVSFASGAAALISLPFLPARGGSRRSHW